MNKSLFRIIERAQMYDYERKTKAKLKQDKNKIKRNN